MVGCDDGVSDGATDGIDVGVSVVCSRLEADDVEARDDGAPFSFTTTKLGDTPVGAIVGSREGGVGAADGRAMGS